MALILNLFALLTLSSVKVLASPAPGLIQNLLQVVALTAPPILTETVVTTYTASTPTTYTSSAYDTDCQCYYSTIYWWTPHPYPTATSSVPETTVTVTPAPTTTTVTVTSTVPTTTTVTTTVTTTAPCTPTLTCDKYGYLVQNVTLFKVDLATGKYSTVKDHLGDNTPVNAIAYNALDNYLYARQDGANQLIRIASDGTTQVVTTFPTTTRINIGDIDTNGTYWHGRDNLWFQLDLKPNSPTYGTLLSNGTSNLSRLGLSIGDWAYIPVGGPYLYTVAEQNKVTVLARFSLETKQWSVVKNYGRKIAQNSWGAVYAINNGTLYASDNLDGQIWAFPIQGGAPYLASRGPVSSSNDGARCVLNLDV